LNSGSDGFENIRSLQITNKLARIKISLKTFCAFATGLTSNNMAAALQLLVTANTKLCPGQLSHNGLLLEAMDGL